MGVEPAAFERNRDLSNALFGGLPAIGIEPEGL
jgi:hypothetical protein